MYLILLIHKAGIGTVTCLIILLIAGIWFRPPPAILGLSIGTIIGFFTATGIKMSSYERLGWTLFLAVGGMVFPVIVLKMDNMQLGMSIGVKVFSLIGVLGQGAYALYDKWAFLAEARKDLQKDM